MTSRVLMIMEGYPWPEQTGQAMRKAAFVEGLEAVADIDLCVLRSATTREPTTDARELARSRCRDVAEFALPERSLTAADRVGWALRQQVPSELLGYDYTDLRRAVRARFDGDYDQVWYLRPRSFHAIGPWEHAELVVDLDDLEDHKLASMPAAPTLAQATKRSLRANAWRRLQNRIIEQATVAIVCSPDDQARLAPMRNVAVVANSYPVPPAQELTVHPDAPTLLFPGSFGYGPNAQAARWLATEIRPELASAVPNAVIRLAGSAPRSIEALAAQRFEVAGFVESMSTELQRASAVIVPLRSGSGTRIKIIEAFAHRVPVISTSIGCEGLGVRDGEHLLVADTPRAFAAACQRVIDEPGLGTALGIAAHSHFRRHFSRDVAIGQIATLASTLSPTATIGSRP